MTKQRTLPTATKPTHRVYLVTGEGKSSYWTPIGAAWPNRDGEGFNLQYHAMPIVTGRIVMRRITERPARAAA